MPAIKILRVITRLNISGLAQYLITLTATLNDGVFESKLVAGVPEGHEGNMAFLAESQGISLIQIDTLCNGFGIFRDVQSFWRLYRILRRERPAIVHLHLMKARFFGGIAAKLARVPVIVETFHGNLFSEYFGKSKTQAILAAERFLGWLIMDRVIAISEGQKKELIRYRVCPAEKAEIIPVGLDLKRFQNCSAFKGKLRKELNLTEKTFLLGIVGRLVSVKGHSYLLEAISRLARSTEMDFSVLIIGDGPLRGALESQARALGIEEQVRFLGWRFDLERVYADLDLVVLASLNEGTPAALIEAMAAGKPVVTTEVGGIPDLVEDGITALVVPPKDSVAMTEAILKLLIDANLRRRLGEMAKDAVYPKYDICRLIQNMKKFYLSLVPSLRILPQERSDH